MAPGNLIGNRVGRASLSLAACLLAISARAAEPCTPVVGELVSVEGEVQVQRADNSRWQQAALGESLCQRDSVRVGTRSRGTIALINEAILRLDQNTTVHLLEITQEPEERSLLDLIIGAFQSFSRAPRTLAVSTPYLNATIEGTEFALRVEAKRSLLTVFEGRVAAANEQGQLPVASGQTVVAEAGKAPAPYTLVRPRDAVQWALYYPPILAALGGQPDQIPPGLSAPLAEALGQAARRDVNGALDVLDRVPEVERDAQYHLYRAALLLSVGRVDEARAGIDHALAMDPRAGLAYALRAVINVVQNQKGDALADAKHAVELSPRETAAKIALSYAQQAQFQLEAARDTLLQATADKPEDALAWARLSELWLMLGYRDRAREAAERAAKLAPNLERVQVVRGFADLAEFRTGWARLTFTQAIARDPADPLPRLGLGLAMISDGALERGRRNLEIAAGLDSSNALLRSYLGKAYFEEKRGPLDADQFAIAKELDPLDPTPYLYDAIRKQSENQPVGALHDIQRSIELNDNRAVYRSRLLLDEDRAARDTSLGRIYDDLGFYQLGLREASKSLTLDPASYSAHRFLSDSYQGVRRAEISRVSELLQAQMLQDVNINPVQPSISETNLNIITQGGPTEAGFNEFTPLFEQNQVQLDASGLAGNEDTFGGEGVVSALYDRLSLSAGGFHFESDGFRPNNDINHNIYNAYAQYAITPELNAQFEYRHRETDFGDLEFAFDPNDFSQTAHTDLNEDIARAGLRYSPAPHSDILLSYIYSNTDTTVQDSAIEGPSVITFDSPANEKTNQIEAQYILKQDWFNVLAGFSYSNSDTDEEVEIAVDGFPVFQLADKIKTNDYRGYVYANIKIPEPVTWTLGLSYAHFDQDATPPNDVDKVNPKFGVQWDVTSDLRVRAAYFENVKPVLAANRTLEPTQVAGFNQFFDDADATKSRRYGVGVDWQVIPDVAIGGELTWRNIEEPFIDASVDPPTVVEDDADEKLYQAYVYWTPLDELAVRAGFVYDKYEKDSDEFSARVGNQNPLEVETFSVPVGVTYFHPSGIFAGAGVTFVNQEVRRLPEFSNQGEDNFVVVDVGIGYRFPKRLGIASLSVRNLFDEGFRFQDDSFREFGDEPTIGPYIPERTIMGRVTLNF
jgi:tetratricopeptide (TPR) repeat protein